MIPRVNIIDHGVGNLLSVRGALDYCGVTPVLTRSHYEIEHADRLLLPGIGAFGTCMADIHRLGLMDPILRFIETGRPLLGICLGMQILMTESEEFGRNTGLDLIPGEVRAIPATDKDGTPNCVPHIGWSGLEPSDGADWRGTVLEGIEPGTEVYFVHSFHTQPANPGHLVATCDYGGHAVTAVVRKDNVTGCQFHPEKSGEAGLAIIKNFLRS